MGANDEHLRYRSGMERDRLTDILTLASARCVEVGTLVAGGSWALRFPPPRKIKFVAVVKGACWLTVEGEVADLPIETGDVFVLPAQHPFVLAGDLNAPQVDGLRIFSDALDKTAKVGDGDDFFAVGAHIALDPKRGGVLAEVLPSFLHVRGSSSEASAMQWLLDQLAKEVAVDRPGAALASRQLAQLLFVQIIRSYVETAGTLTCLQNLRMRLAEHELREGSTSVSELGLSLGYASESAFSNAFKRTTGMAPKRYRSIFAKDQSTPNQDQDRVEMLGPA